MRTPNLAELQASRNLQNLQTGAPLNAFNRGAEIRHAMLDTWWERGLAIVSLAGLVVFVVNLVRWSIWP